MRVAQAGPSACLSLYVKRQWFLPLLLFGFLGTGSEVLRLETLYVSTAAKGHQSTPKSPFQFSSIQSSCKGEKRELPGGMVAAQLTRVPSIPGSWIDCKSVYRLKSHPPAACRSSNHETSNHDLGLQFRAHRELGAPTHPNTTKSSQVAGALLLAGCWVSMGSGCARPGHPCVGQPGA